MTKESQLAPTMRFEDVKAVKSQRDGQALYRAELDQYLTDIGIASQLERLDDLWVKNIQIA